MAYITEIEDDSSRVLAQLVTTHDKYLLSDGSKRFVDTSPAWCRGCRRFVNVERLESPEDLERQAREFCAQRHDNRLFPEDIFPVERQREINDALLRKWLHEAEQWRLALAQRHSSPRCLECGGINYIVISKDGEWVKHPASPGHQVRAHTVAHASMALWGRLYDTEGRQIPGRDASP